MNHWNQCNWSSSEQTFQKAVSSVFSCTTWYLKWKKQNCPRCGVFLLIHSGGGYASGILELLLSSSDCYSRFLQNSEIIVTLLSLECTLLSVAPLWSVCMLFPDRCFEREVVSYSFSGSLRKSELCLIAKAGFVFTDCMSNSSVSCLAGVHTYNVSSTAVRNSSEIRCCTSFQENNWTNQTTSPKSMLNTVVTTHWKVWFGNKGFRFSWWLRTLYQGKDLPENNTWVVFFCPSLPLKTLLLNS